jgi:hypothetical protein
MEKKIIGICVIALFMLEAAASKTNKIQSNDNAGHLTAEVFCKHKLTCGFDYNISVNKFKSSELQVSSNGFVVLNGGKHQFETNKINVFQKGDNQSYRIFGKDKYQILDTVDFFLYYRYGQSGKTKGAALVKAAEYYFSKDGVSPIQLLTAENLKRTFPDNNAFHYAIDSHFKTDKDLIAYDPYIKCYKIKYLYKQSLK